MSMKDNFARIVRDSLANESSSVRAMAMRSGIPVRSFQSVLDGRQPSIGRAEEICDALGLEFYIGPRREVKDPLQVLPTVMPEELEGPLHELVRIVINAGGNPIPEDLWPVISVREYIADAPSTADIANDDPLSEDATDAEEDVLMVDFAEDVRAAAGSGAMVFEEAADLQVAVPRTVLPQWVSTRGLICIRAAGDSMEPHLHDGDLILIDRHRIEPVDNEVFVIHTEDGLVVKRVRKTDDGWQMTSDNPKYKSRPLGECEQNVGRVAWSGPLPATEAGGGEKR